MPIVPIVAHAGEEVLLIVAGVWIVYLLIKGMRGGRAETSSFGPCLYCGTMLTTADSRCPTCGFRARRGSLGSPLAPRTPGQDRSAR
jgi:hypothetical protein